MFNQRNLLLAINISRLEQSLCWTASFLSGSDDFPGFAGTGFALSFVPCSSSVLITAAQQTVLLFVARLVAIREPRMSHKM